jgi:hypothetical protein
MFGEFAFRDDTLLQEGLKRREPWAIAQDELHYKNGIAVPNPRTNGPSIMPGQPIPEVNDFTNAFTSYHDIGIDYWVSYRDVYGRPWKIGTFGIYSYGSNAFKMNKIYANQYRQPDQTNR